MKKVSVFSTLMLLAGSLVVGVVFMSAKPNDFDTWKVTDYRAQWDTVTVLKNPHKGWYQHFYDNQIEGYKIKDKDLFCSFPGMDHLYLRLAWSFLEPEEGRYDWKLIDAVVAEYVPLGYGISFRITCKETGQFPWAVGQQKGGVNYATPVWVEEAGAKGVVVDIDGTKSWTPQWDDSVYLAKLDNFHRAFAARYDGQPFVRYVDVGSIGDWGEGHTFFSTGVPVTVTDVKKNLDVYLRNYKKTQIVVAYGYIFDGKSAEGEKELYKYLVNSRITLRNDSPLVAGYIENYLPTWSISHPYLFNGIYENKPIILEMAHYLHVIESGNWIGKNGGDVIPQYGYSGATILTKAIETIHATYIGFHGYAETWLSDNPDLSRILANKCGYWYFPVEAKYPSVIGHNNNPLQITWKNKGVAPAYNQYELILRFANAESSFYVHVLDSQNKTWGEVDVTCQYSYSLPTNTIPGKYQLSMKLFDKITSQTVKLGIKNTYLVENEFIPIGEVQFTAK
ncbi:hypothetical protein AGMMS49982_10940 [Bacteroidia bacterium]|nr:hypothetical protein AGMMS49982_10940 [Bacteroidia bacterium]